MLGEKRKILDMYLILIETYWWGDGDDNGDDKNEVRSQQVLNSIWYIKLEAT